jgi:hypothetical protein
MSRAAAKAGEGAEIVDALWRVVRPRRPACDHDVGTTRI